MAKLFFLILLVAASTLHAVSQSGRRVSTPRSAPAAPIQPPANPEPEVRQPVTILAAPRLNFLPERIRERQINDLESGSFRFADFEGKVVVINLWASWCGPCRREVPEYERVRKDYEGQAIEFIGLTTEDPRTSSAKVKKFVRDANFSFRIGWADIETARTLMNGQDGIPQTLVVDARGRIVDHWIGYGPGRGGRKLKMAIDHALQVVSGL
ncbi:MAG TPA: TlpA disulfide reductase family protein [Pyrinomonadaceae bacterium]|nr:TlpA disulfide reductase family protein [Pyrinomonadaceae bacterium]